jgi:excinuclease ABC subunit C
MTHPSHITIPNTHDAILKHVPTTTGVYVYKAKETPIYIGKAVSLRARILSHEQNAKDDPKEARIVENADTIELIVTDSEFKALLLEAELIRTLMPRYNVRWRDDKSYLYIKISNEKFPKVSLSRRENDGVSTYIGPFSSTRLVERMLRDVRRIVPFCMQKNNRVPCFYSKIGLCSPCPGEITLMQKTDPAKAASMVRHYRRNIRLLTQILRGQSDLVYETLRKQVKMFSKKEQYEDALNVRRKMDQFAYLLKRAAMNEDLKSGNYNSSQRALSQLKQILEPFFPAINLYRIECYDNSTLGFTNSTASMVVFEDGLVNKKEYRRFKLKKNTNNDFEMMQEVITRRACNKTWKIPGLVVIDGGRPQLEAVRRALASLPTTEHALSNVPIIGLAKHPDRIVIMNDEFTTLKVPHSNAGMQLLQSLRDEAHRFARRYHAFLRKKTHFQA